MTLAVGIVSGGLDSLVATRWLMQQGFEVTALHFVIGFEPTHLRYWMQHPGEPAPAPEAIVRTGARVEVIDVREAFLELLLDPPHGFGANLNPCIDCKILMLRRAKARLEELGGAFVFTGEVVGQRPMSQHRQALDTIARESGLAGRLVRPLCGQLLSPTLPEQEGILRQDQLLDLSGRSRARQTELAERLGVGSYPTPAGGCLLTDPAYAARARALMGRRPQKRLRLQDPLLLLTGRHVALPEGSLAVIGRQHEENLVLERFAGDGVLLAALDVAGPTTLVEGAPSARDLEVAARLTARYGQGRGHAEVRIGCRRPDGSECILTVSPIVD
jgi:hypothetical protein